MAYSCTHLAMKCYPGYWQICSLMWTKSTYLTQKRKSANKIFFTSFHTMTSSKGNIFRVTGPLWGEFTGHRWIPLTKASQWRTALMGFFTCVWTKGCANNRDAGDLRRHRAHYDVTLMIQLSVGKIYITDTDSHVQNATLSKIKPYCTIGCFKISHITLLKLCSLSFVLWVNFRIWII